MATFETINVLFNTLDPLSQGMLLYFVVAGIPLVLSAIQLFTLLEKRQRILRSAPDPYWSKIDLDEEFPS